MVGVTKEAVKYWENGEVQAEQAQRLVFFLLKFIGSKTLPYVNSFEKRFRPKKLHLI